MQLTVQRTQADVRGMLGGHKGVNFTLQTQLLFTEEEQQLINHYKMWDYSAFTQGGLPVTLRELAAGRVQTLANVEVLLANEAVVKEALDSIPPLLGVLRSFGGQEVIPYPRDTLANASAQ